MPDQISGQSMPLVHTSCEGRRLGATVVIILRSCTAQGRRSSCSGRLAAAGEASSGAPASSYPLPPCRAVPCQAQARTKRGGRQGGWPCGTMARLLLASGGRLVLINDRLTNIPMFIMGFYLLQYKIAFMTNWIGCDSVFLFYRSKEQGKHKYHMIKWEAICSPKEKGGLGVINTKNYELVPYLKVGMENSSWARWTLAGNNQSKVLIERGNGLPPKCQTIPICQRGAKGATTALLGCWIPYE